MSDPVDKTAASASAGVSSDGKAATSLSKQPSELENDWADADDTPLPMPGGAPSPAGNNEASGADDAKVDEELAQVTAAVNTPDIDALAPDLTSGELIVREAGFEQGNGPTQPVTNFSSLDIDDSLKKAIQEVKGWQTMSKIQQIGLPLILKNPPLNVIGQAQAGTGKTGTFVVSMLARITADVKPSTPQGLILCVTQEYST